MKRVLTALVLVPVAVYAALFAPGWLFLVIVAVAAVLCFREYAQITGTFFPIGCVAGILILIAPPHEFMILVILSTLAAMCLPLGATDIASGVSRAAWLVMGIFYVFGAWKTAVLVHDGMPHAGRFGVPAGHHWVLFGLMVNWVGDTGAYYVGRRFGSRKLAPAVSPGKSWEGAAASALTGVTFGALYVPFMIGGVNAWVAAGVALLVNIAGQLGDLAESAIKRGAGVKDSGTLLPGHGGFLDRVDSTLFAMPVLYSLLALSYSI